VLVGVLVEVVIVVVVAVGVEGVVRVVVVAMFQTPRHGGQRQDDLLFWLSPGPLHLRSGCR
jgi:hypothetical protein